MICSEVSNLLYHNLLICSKIFIREFCYFNTPWRLYMIALKIIEVGSFMNKLLRSDIFDNFLLQEAVITNGASFVIDGHINKDYYTEEELTELDLTDCKSLPFSVLRTNCFDLIKGKKTPSYFKFVFALAPKNLERTIASSGSSFTVNDISAVFMNLKFQNNILSVTTGVSYNIFSPDKTLDFKWDELVKLFFKKHEIFYEEM